MFRQEGDMGRYVAFNDPGQPGAGFSNLEEYLAAGNQMPQLPTREPLKAANPLGGGLGQIIPNPGAGIANIFPGNPNRKPPDPIMQGFQESEFRKKANNMQQDAVNFKYKGQDMMMNSSMAGAFKQYLDSIGKGDLYEPEVRLSGPLQKVGIDDQLNPLNPVSGYQQATPPLLDGTKGFPVTVSGDNSIATTQQVPFDRVGQQMINFDDMFGPLNTRLNKIEEGIASLLQDRGQGLNMNAMPTTNLNNFFQEPIGRFPFRSFYG